jgi:AcrR family transcriptional regulator
VDDQAEDQNDQPKQRAEHDDCAQTQAPSDTVTAYNSGHYYKNKVKPDYREAVNRSARFKEQMTVPQRPSPKKQAAADMSTQVIRRPRGEPRRLLLDAARELFARQDYRSTTTREIAEVAGVSEYLLFRYFGSKAGLFREALVVPFTTFVDQFGQTWRSVVPEETDEEELARHFVEQLYDLVVENRGLLLTLVASEAFSEAEIADAGIGDIRRALAVLGQISAEGMQVRGMRSSQPDLPAHSTVAMIVGMVALRSTFFGAQQPSRETIVDELVQAILHGFLHRHE